MGIIRYNKLLETSFDLGIKGEASPSKTDEMLSISLCLMTDMYLFIPNQRGEVGVVSGGPGSRSQTGELYGT